MHIINRKNISPYFHEYDRCCVCPKSCGVNRNRGIKGFCRETNELRLAWAGLHFGEEPPVSGARGSGVIFVTGCSLRCAFCQNYLISQEGKGKAVGQKEFTDICLALQKTGAENINIVTGTHASPAIIAFLKEAKKKGLSIPIVWNTSSYETEANVEALSEVVDIWLPDIKTKVSEVAQAAFKSSGYPEIACRAVIKMAELSPIIFDNTADKKDYPFGKMISGVIVRHLALPGRIEDTKQFISWFASKLKDKTLLSLMTQYTPIKNALKSSEPMLKERLPFEQRFINKEEDINLRLLLSQFGIENGFYQELVQDSNWLPDFTKTQPFSSNLSKPVWSYISGFCLS